MQRLLRRRPRRLITVERRTGIDRRIEYGERPWAHKTSHFWMGLSLGIPLATLSLGLTISVIDDSFNLVWQSPSLVPLDRLSNPVFALAFLYSGIMLLADCAEKLPKRWQRYWLAWTPAVMSYTWIMGFAALAAVSNELRPVGTLCAYGGIWLGMVCFLIMGPELRDRAGTTAG